jgi:hypothetical protein
LPIPRIAAFSPGQSPPLVKIPSRFVIEPRLPAPTLGEWRWCLRRDSIMRPQD